MKETFYIESDYSGIFLIKVDQNLDFKTKALWSLVLEKPSRWNYFQFDLIACFPDPNSVEEDYPDAISCFVWILKGFVLIKIPKYLMPDEQKVIRSGAWMSSTEVSRVIFRILDEQRKGWRALEWKTRNDACKSKLYL